MATVKERRQKRSASTATKPVLPTIAADQRVVAVTGAAGFIGSETIKRLEEDRRYQKILAIDIRKPSFPLDKTQFYKVDLTLPTADADLGAILAREGTDSVLHAAFLSAPTHAVAWAHELEDVGTMHVLNACAEARIRRLVVSSTTLIYGADPANPNFITEDTEPRPTSDSPYIQDKIGAERQVARFARENPDTCVSILRCAPILGPVIQNFVTRFFARPVAPRIMGYDPLVQLVHEDDVVTAFKLALDGDHPGAFNIAGDGVLPYSTVLAMMGKLPVPVPHFLLSSLQRALWAMQVADVPPSFLGFLRYLCVADGSRARRELGFAPRHDIKATIHDFLGIIGDEMEKQAPRREAAAERL